jgi:hypothetical protein
MDAKQKQNNIQLDVEFVRRVESFACSRGVAPAEVLREAFEEYEANHNGGAPPKADGEGESVFDRWTRLGLIGCIDDPSLPTDLSTNPKYMEGFGSE